MDEAELYKKTKRVSLGLTELEYQSMLAQANAMGFDDVVDYLLMLHWSSLRQEESKQEKTIKKAPSPEGRYYPSKVFETTHGSIYKGNSSILMNNILGEKSIDLIMTSPPYGLVRKKDYGNEETNRYITWFEEFAEGFRRVLKPNGSLIIDIGGAWKKSMPTRSLYHFDLLIKLCRDYGFHLAQEFYWWNPAKLPCPAEWTNIRRVRVKDAVNCIWWLSPTPYPKATNRRVLQPYSESMLTLLEKGYKPKLRPSGHNISDKFKQDLGGSIPPNLIALANNESNGAYQRYCHDNNLKEHPARFPAGIPGFFITMLTNPGDVVLDPFAGSCVTGEVCEHMGRKWICCEISEQYVLGAKGRFVQQHIVAGGMESSRSEPYKIWPPLSLPIDETKEPLVEDGGLLSPRKKKKLAQEEHDPA